MKSVIYTNKEKPDIKQHRILTEKLHNTFQEKNIAYGNSFRDTFKEYGIIAALTRITDKFNRFKTLALKRETCAGDESIIDTLMDMANYCLMTVMEIKHEDNRDS